MPPNQLFSCIRIDNLAADGVIYCRQTHQTWCCDLDAPGSLQFPCRAMQNVPVSWSWRAAVVRRKPQMAKPLSRCAALRRAGWMATGWLLDGGGIHSGTAGFRFCKAWNQWMSHCHGSDISRAPFDPDGYLVESYLILQATSRPQGLEAQKPLTTDGKGLKEETQMQHRRGASRACMVSHWLLFATSLPISLPGTA